MHRLLAAADGDMALAQRGIVVLDEIDKIARNEREGAEDVGGAAVQHCLLKIVEGNF